MLSWKQLPYFLAVARAGSLRAGAETLGATHATTRRQIDALEARLGVRLLTRARAGVTLTEAGRRLLDEALEAERHLTAAEARVRGLDREASGLVRLSCEPMIAHHLLGPILAGFAARYPDVDFDLTVHDAFDDVANQAADVALRIAAQVGPGVEARRIAAFEVATFASRAYVADRVPLAGPGGAGLAWVGYDDGGAEGRIAASAYPAARMRYRSGDLDSLIELVRAGAGLAVLPVWVATRYPELQRLPGAKVDTGRGIWLVINADLARVTRVRLFVAGLGRALAAALGAGAPA